MRCNPFWRFQACLSLSSQHTRPRTTYSVRDMKSSVDSIEGRSAGQNINLLWSSYHNDILFFQPLSHIRHSLNGRVLDIGSGIGEQTRLINSFGASSIGLDLEPSGKDSIRGTAVKIPFKDGSFGVVICMRTLQHIREDKIALREMRRVMRPGGYLIMAVANTRSYTMISLKTKGKWRGRERIPYEWYRTYTEEEVNNLLRSEGFEIIESDVVGFAPEILHRRPSSLSKFTLRAIMEVDKALRVMPVLGPRGVHVRVIARLKQTPSSDSARAP